MLPDQTWRINSFAFISFYYKKLVNVQLVNPCFRRQIQIRNRRIEETLPQPFFYINYGDSSVTVIKIVLSYSENYGEKLPCLHDEEALKEKIKMSKSYINVTFIFTCLPKSNKMNMTAMKSKCQIKLKNRAICEVD